MLWEEPTIGGMREGAARTVGGAGALKGSIGVDCVETVGAGGAFSCPKPDEISTLGAAGSAGGLGGTDGGGGIAEEARAASCTRVGADPDAADDSGKAEA